MDALITLEGVSKSFHGKTILKNINMQVERGVSLAFMGHNGAGKTTILKILAGLLNVTEGKVCMLPGLILHYVPENFPPCDLTVKSYLTYMGKLDGLGGRVLEERIHSLLKEFFMEEMAQVSMKQVSKGTLQKTGVIQALLTRPDILFLDEPLSGQDQESQKVFIEKMHQLKEQGTTLLLVCHESFLARALADVTYRVEKQQLRPQIWEESRKITQRLVFEGNMGEGWTLTEYEEDVEKSDPLSF